jgi:hypothetical protein
MLQRNYCIDLLLENASSFTEKSQIQKLTEAEQAVVNDRMIGNLYQSALKKKNINFDNIPNSKGDIQRVDGYDNMLATLSVLRGLSKKFGINIPEIEIVEDAINNIRVHKPLFDKGFKLNIDFLQMYYNTLVYACIESTSLILSSYVEYTRTVNSVEFQLRKGKGVYGNVCIDSLVKFNKQIKDGSFVKFARGLIDKGSENFLGTIGSTSLGAAVKTGVTGFLSAHPVAAGVMATIAVAATIVPVVRELIYYFYESRMQVSEYLNHQKEFIEMNKFKLESSSMDAQKRNKILDKQKGVINRLEKISDKVRVNQQIANKNANNKIKDDNKGYTLSSVTDGGDDGFTFI